MRLCKDCKHYIPQRVISCFLGQAVIEAKCRQSDVVGDRAEMKSCVEERSTDTNFHCGRSAMNWEAK